MRFDQRLTFVKEGEGGGYDPEKGEYVEGEEERDTVSCHLSPMSVDRIAKTFGSMEQNITIARLQRPYNSPYDRVEIDDTPYAVKKKTEYRGRLVLFLEGA